MTQEAKHSRRALERIIDDLELLTPEDFLGLYCALAEYHIPGNPLPEWLGEPHNA